MIYAIGYAVGAVLTWAILAYFSGKYGSHKDEADEITWIVMAGMFWPFALFLFVPATIITLVRRAARSQK